MVHGAGGSLLEHVKEHRLHVDLRPGHAVLPHTTAWMMWNWQLSALSVGAHVVVLRRAGRGPETLWELVARHGVTVFGTSPAYLQLCQDDGYPPRDALDSQRAPRGALHRRGAARLAVRLGRRAVGRRRCSRSPAAPTSSALRALPPRAARAAGPLPVPEPGPGRRRRRRRRPRAGRGRSASWSAATRSRPGRSGSCATPTASVSTPPTSPPTPACGPTATGSSSTPTARPGSTAAPTACSTSTASGSAPRRSTRWSGGARDRRRDRRRAAGPHRARRHPAGAARRAPRRRRLDAGPEQAIRATLRRQASAAHVPSLILAVREVPLTHNGKRSERAARDALNGDPVANLSALKNPASVDGIAVALAAAEDERAAAEVLAAAGTDEVAAVVGRLWRETLGPAADAEHTFTDLGGTSRQAMTLVRQVRVVLGRDVQLEALLADPTLPGLTAAARCAPRADDAPPVVLLAPGDPALPPLFCVHDAWGDIDVYWPLAQLLTDTGPVHGLRTDLHRPDGTRRSIAELAAEHASTIERIAPVGTSGWPGTPSAAWWRSRRRGCSPHRGARSTSSAWSTSSRPAPSCPAGERWPRGGRAGRAAVPLDARRTAARTGGRAAESGRGFRTAGCSPSRARCSRRTVPAGTADRSPTSAPAAASPRPPALPRVAAGGAPADRRRRPRRAPRRPRPGARRGGGPGVVGGAGGDPALGAGMSRTKLGGAAGGSRTCRCGHAHELHRHHRPGDDCATARCLCVQFRWRLLRPGPPITAPPRLVLLPRPAASLLGRIVADGGPAPASVAADHARW